MAGVPTGRVDGGFPRLAGRRLGTVRSVHASMISLDRAWRLDTPTRSLPRSRLVRDADLVAQEWVDRKLADSARHGRWYAVSGRISR